MENLLDSKYNKNIFIPLNPQFKCKKQVLSRNTTTGSYKNVVGNEKQQNFMKNYKKYIAERYNKDIKTNKKVLLT